MTTEKISGREHGKGHVTVTTVRCNCSNWTDTAFQRTYSC